ncbi:phosphopantetheine-binding protein [Actinokineospora sp. G85]|uniref:phosphopantetheine-binding protein n=1 Tax=Actinokineospora sp. G85 TaxID=3406626 RepID=UPI003C713061
MSDPNSAAVDARLAKSIRVPYTDDSTLTEVGLDSLTTIRIAVALVPDDDREIDAGDLAGLRTVGQMRAWLLDLVRDAAPAGGTR